MNPDIPPDVFAAPAGASESAPPGDVRVFSPGQVALGTFIGTSIARGLLVAWNAHTVGRPVWPPILAGFLALGGLIGIAAVLPEDLPTAPFNLAMLLVAHAYASAQNRAYGVENAPLRSSWLAVGVGMLGLVPILAVIGVLFFVAFSAP